MRYSWNPRPAKERIRAAIHTLSIANELAHAQQIHTHIREAKDALAEAERLLLEAPQ